MGFFLGCCVIAAVIWYVARKLYRAIVSVGVMLETIGARTIEDWPSDEEFERAGRRFMGW